MTDDGNGKKSAYFRGRRLEGRPFNLSNTTVFKAEVKSNTKLKNVDDIEGIENEVEQINTFENIAKVKEFIVYNEVGDQTASTDILNIPNILDIADAFHSN